MGKVSRWEVQASPGSGSGRGEAGHPGTWGEGEACPLPSCPGLTGDETT